MNHFRKAILVTSLISLVVVGCSERKSALPAAGAAESKTAAEESIPAADQPAP